MFSHSKSGLRFDMYIVYDDQIRRYKPGCVFFKDGLWTDVMVPQNPSQDINFLSKEEDAKEISKALIKQCISAYMKDNTFLSFKNTERP